MLLAAALVAALLVPAAAAGAARAATDTTPPSVPQGLIGVAQPNRYIELSWQPSTDDSGLPVKYRVFRDNVAIGKKIAATEYLDRPASVGTYQYKVRAIDAAGNKSAFSPTISVKAVKSLAAADTTPPTTPRNLTGTVQPKRHVELSWSASTDNQPGPITYRVFRNGKAIGTKQTATTFVDRPASGGTYSYKVRAFDAAGNRSPFSYTIERTVSPGALDTTAPTVPKSVSGGQGSHGQAVITWQASSDDRVGDIWYHVRRDGLRIATVKSTSYHDYRAGLVAAGYTYTIQAADGAGNVSDASAGVQVDVNPALFPWGGVVYKNGSRQKAVVALTFDDGYRSANMLKIANILRDHGVTGSFFPTGEAVELAPHVWADIARDFPLGNHTYRHPRLTTRTEQQIETQIRLTTLAIEAHSGRAMPALMRPPGGYQNQTVRDVMKSMGLPVVLWDIDTRDWESSSTAASVRDTALTAKNGSIILLHDGSNVVQALPEIIAGLRAKGLTLVSLDELLGMPWQPAHR